MVRQDISVILIRAPALKPKLVAGYRSALPQGKLFAEHVISEIDPAISASYAPDVRERSTTRMKCSCSTTPHGFN
jgi:hypothetical protein